MWKIFYHFHILNHLTRIEKGESFSVMIWGYFPLKIMFSERCWDWQLEKDWKNKWVTGAVPGSQQCVKNYFFSEPAAMVGGSAAPGNCQNQSHFENSCRSWSCEEWRQKVVQRCSTAVMELLYLDCVFI